MAIPFKSTPLVLDTSSLDYIYYTKQSQIPHYNRAISLKRPWERKQKFIDIDPLLK
jgi:hypothetical protein